MKDPKKDEKAESAEILLGELEELTKAVARQQPETLLRSPYTHPSAAELNKKWRFENGQLVEVPDESKTLIDLPSTPPSAPKQHKR